MNTFRRLCRSVLPCLASLGAVPAGVAQPSISPPGATSSGTSAEAESGVLTEIIVTARRRTESVQDVPSSVTAVSEQQLQASDVLDLRGLAAVVPGISFSSMEPDHSEVTIRGITSGNTPSPTVGFYVDDVAIDTIYLGSTGLNGQFEPSLFDTQRVEVLSGPQGSLYGGSALGGAVKFVSNRAVLDRTSVTTNAELTTVTNGGTGYLGYLVMNLPVVSDVAAIRFGAYYRDLPGFVNRVVGGEGLTPPLLSRPTFISFNTTTDHNVNEYETAAFRIAGTIVPATDWTIAPEFSYQNTQSSDVGTIWPNLPRFEQSFVTHQPTQDRLMLGTLTVEGLTPLGALTGISSWSEAVEQTTRDVTAFVGGAIPVFANLVSPSVEGFTSHRVSEEVRISQADAKSPFQYVAGLFYRDMTVPDRQDIYTDGSGVTEPGLPADLVFGGLTTEKIREDAGFGEASYRWGMAELTAGGRLYHISTQVVFAGDGLFNGGPSISGAASSESGFSPKLEVTLKPTPTNLVYALADKGFRPGGGNTAIPTACAADLAALGLSAMPLQFHSDSLWNYEVGSKNTLLGGILTLNGSLFYMDWSHIQQSVALPTCGFGFTGNVGAAVSKGGEFDIDTHFGGLTLHGGIVYDNAYVTQTAPGTAAQLGDPIEQAPKVTASTAVDYVFPLRSGVRGTLHLDYAYHGSQAQSFNKSYLSSIDPLSGVPLGGVMTVADPSYLQPHYELASGSVGVLVGSWNVRFIVQNLFNARPLLGLMSTGSLANNAFSLAPRTFTLAAHVDF